MPPSPSSVQTKGALYIPMVLLYVYTVCTELEATMIDDSPGGAGVVWELGGDPRSLLVRRLFPDPNSFV